MTSTHQFETERGWRRFIREASYREGCFQVQPAPDQGNVVVGFKSRDDQDDEWYLVEDEDAQRLAEQLQMVAKYDPD